MGGGVGPYSSSRSFAVHASPRPSLDGLHLSPRNAGMNQYFRSNNPRSHDNDNSRQNQTRNSVASSPLSPNRRLPRNNTWTGEKLFSRRGSSGGGGGGGGGGGAAAEAASEMHRIANFIKEGWIGGDDGERRSCRVVRCGRRGSSGGGGGGGGGGGDFCGLGMLGGAAASAEEDVKFFLHQSPEKSHSRKFGKSSPITMIRV